MINEAQIDGVLVAGQPSDGELDELPRRGITTLVNVRMPDELDEPEAAKVPAGITYCEVPFTGATLNAEHVARVRDALSNGGKALVHCAGGTRAAVVAAIVTTEHSGGNANDALARIASAGFEIDGTPYQKFVDSYFTDASR